MIECSDKDCQACRTRRIFQEMKDDGVDMDLCITLAMATIGEVYGWELVPDVELRKESVH